MVQFNTKTGLPGEICATFVSSKRRRIFWGSILGQQSFLGLVFAKWDVFGIGKFRPMCSSMSLRFLRTL